MLRKIMLLSADYHQIFCNEHQSLMYSITYSYGSSINKIEEITMNLIKFRKELWSFSTLTKLQEISSEGELRDHDRLLTFNRKYHEFRERVKHEQPSVWNDKLNQTQKDKLSLLVKGVASLGILEMRYFESLSNEAVTKQLKLDQITRAMTKEELHSKCIYFVNMEEDPIYYGANPKWFEQQEALAKLWPLGQQGFALAFASVKGGASGNSTGTSTGSIESAASPDTDIKPEQKMEKLNYDVQLTAYDQTQKIKIIKEIREILKLGLKEAKDLVESAPCTLQKAAKKEDAEKLKTKLEELKCEITLL